MTISSSYSEKSTYDPDSVFPIDFFGNRGNTCLINVKFNKTSEITIKKGAIGASTVAKAGDINVTMLVEQQTTPLANADEPAITVEADEVVVVCNDSDILVFFLESV